MEICTSAQTIAHATSIALLALICGGSIECNLIRESKKDNGHDADSSIMTKPVRDQNDEECTNNDDCCQSDADGECCEENNRGQNVREKNEKDEKVGCCKNKNKGNRDNENTNRNDSNCCSADKNGKEERAKKSRCCKDKRKRNEKTANGHLDENNVRRSKCCKDKNRNGNKNESRCCKDERNNGDICCKDENIREGNEEREEESCCKHDAKRSKNPATDQQSKSDIENDVTNTKNFDDLVVGNGRANFFGKENRQQLVAEKKEVENKFTKRDDITLKSSEDEPKLPREYEEMVHRLDKSSLLEISLLLNKFRTTINNFDDYADQVEKETGLGIKGRVEFIDAFEEYIHRAQYILKLRLYKVR